MTTITGGDIEVRGTLSAAAFAVSILAFQVLLIVFGLAGIPGNSVMTVSWIVFGEMAILALSWRMLTLGLPDFIFAGFSASMLLSIILSYDPSLISEYARFLICVPAAYAAGRTLSRPAIARTPDVMLIVSGVIVLFSVLAILQSLIAGDLDGKNRSPIFGFHHAPNVLAAASGCLAISFIYSSVRKRSVLSFAIHALIFVACAAFVASLVRFTFLAVLATVICTIGWLLFMRQRERAARAALVLLVCSTSCAAAVYLRPFGVINYTKEAAADVRAALTGPISTSATSAAKPPSCTDDVRADHSVELRAYLLKDAIFFLPTSGFMGYGLGSFPSLTCLTGYQVHNIFLQTIIEAGWVTGSLLLALVLILAAGLILNPAAGFLLSSMIFYIILGMGHGSIAIALPLFLVAGAAAAMKKVSQ